ncbi:MAG: FHA domain-containing protein [Verrucomicrobiota bacterium]|jgi:predicted component of type VI protein secretion system|nr:FHA domain-containing protein [Verrucomicrobiota bacterium]
MAKLIGMTGEFKDREYPIEQGDVTIGRKADNVILLDHPTISSHHCVIMSNAESCTVQDLDSTNGTRVNAREIQTADLHHKDLLQLGSVEFMMDAPELATSAARYTKADAEMTVGNMAAPQDFNTISPFGAPPKERKGTWYFLLIVVGILTLCALVVYFFMLFGAS